MAASHHIKLISLTRSKKNPARFQSDYNKLTKALNKTNPLQEKRVCLSHLPALAPS